jgi:hypothetical protein
LFLVLIYVNYVMFVFCVRAVEAPIRGHKS